MNVQGDGASCPRIDQEELNSNIDNVLDFLGENTCTPSGGSKSNKYKKGGGCGNTWLGQFLNALKTTNKVTPTPGKAVELVKEVVNQNPQITESLQQVQEIPDETYLLLTVLAATKIPGLLNSLCNLSKETDRITDQYRPRQPNLAETQTLHRKPLISETIPKILNMLKTHPNLDAFVTWGNFTMHSNGIYLHDNGWIDEKQLETLLSVYNGVNSKELQITFPGKTIDYSEIFKLLDASLDSPLVIDVVEPDPEDYIECFPALKTALGLETEYGRKLKITNYYKTILEKSLTDLNAAILAKKSNANVRAGIRFQYLSTLPLTRPGQLQEGYHHSKAQGRSLTYLKTTERFMYKGKNRIIWKKSTRKNSASFIQVKGHFINIKSV